MFTSRQRQDSRGRARARGRSLFRPALPLAVWLSASLGHADEPANPSPPEIEPPPAPLIVDPPAATTPPPPATPAPATTLAPVAVPAISPRPTADPASVPPADSAPIKNIESLDLKDLLNEPVVTAGGGIEEERSLASANVYTISRDEIAAHGYRSLAELLATVPNLYVIDDLVLPSLGVRGTTGGVKAGTRLVKVMINGQSVNFRPELTSFLGPEFIPIEAVERVEIAKGPLSALYGANAFIATVNVITRDPSPSLHVEAAGRATFYNNAGFGGSGLLNYGDKNRGMLLAITLDQIDRSGINLQRTFTNDYFNSDLFERRSNDDKANPLGVFGRFYIGTDNVGRFILSAGLQRLDSKGEFQINSVLTHQTRIALVNAWLQLRYEKSWSKVSLVATTGYSQGDPTSDYRLNLTGNNTSLFRPNYGYKAVDGKAEVTYKPLGERLSLLGGVDFEWTREQVLYYTQTLNQVQGLLQPGDTVDLIARKVSREQTYYDVGAFLQLASTPFTRLPGLHFTGNLRLDKIAFGPVDFPLQFSWRLSAAYRISSNWTARLFGGQAFQNPSGVMLFAQPGFGSANNVIGNLTVAGLPALSPQNITSTEALVSGRLFTYLTLEVAAYYRALQNEIEFTRQGLDFVATNAGIDRGIGFESVLRFSYRWFSAYGNASFDAPIRDGVFGDKPSPLFPRGMGLIGLDIHVPQIYLHANTQVRIIGPRGASQSNTYINNDRFYELPTYALWDLTLSSVGLRLFGGDSETRVLVSGRNLLGETAPDPGAGGFDLPRLGRSFLVEIRQIF
ncbi:MAG: TonB-dependent receptor [Myxococcales bacterium]|nr:TonB-dependent receptor [Myxococcales bacterium]